MTSYTKPCNTCGADLLFCHFKKVNGLIGNRCKDCEKLCRNKTERQMLTCAAPPGNHDWDRPKWRKPNT